MKKLSSKDKLFLMLIAAGLIVIWVFYSLIFSFFIRGNFHESEFAKKIFSDKKAEWLNVSRPLEVSDLENRIILLDFWTYACVNCIQTLPEIQRIEKDFGSRLTVIGVHSAKFDNEKDIKAVRKAILKYNITHPVVNDSNLKIWNEFSINAWPSFILVDPRGSIVRTYIGENQAEKIRQDVKKLITKFRYQINRKALPLLPEGASDIANVLSFPTKLRYISAFSYKLRKVPAILIANSGQNNIIVSSLSGEILLKIGSKKDLFQDGDVSSASFSAPQGLLYDNEKIYVADTGNHALRLVDLKEGKVTTLIGSGRKGEIAEGEMAAKDFDLASPTDIEFFPDKNHIAIANSGTHQILSYDIKENKLSVLAGNGIEGIDDGEYPKNSLAQTSDMSAYGGNLYFVDSETSSLRVIDKSGDVKTLIGKGLFDFGYKNGSKSEALMQHPLGLLVDDTGAYISDSFNHSIRKYDFFSGQITDFVGSKTKGEKTGAKNSTEFDQPESIISIFDRFYVADSNNNRIVILDRGNLNSSIFDVMPSLKLPKEGFLEYLPNLQKIETVKVKPNSKISLKINLKKGWKINEMGPSFINLLELVKDHQANLITSFDWNNIKNKDMKLPNLKAEKEYILQGTVYYCEDKKDSLCYIKSYEQKVSADDDKNLEIEIKLGE